MYGTSLSDDSSVLEYTPYSEGSLEGGVEAALQAGWIAWYSGSQTNFNTVGGESAAGDSYHITSFPGASVELQFYGTGVSLYGFANCSYQATIDSGGVRQYSPEDNLDKLLFTTGTDSLTPGTHFVNLTALPNPNSTQQLSFDNAVVSDATLAQEPIPVVYNNSDYEVLQYDGTWTVPTVVAGIPNTSDPSPFHQTVQYGSSVSMNFTGASAVIVKGPRNWGHAGYNVSLDGINSQYNASSYWLIGDSLLFYQRGLDVNETHYLDVIDTSPNGDKFILNYITVFNKNTIEPSSNFSVKKSVNAGVIVGPVVAGVVVLVLLALIVMRHRRRKIRPEDHITPYPWWQNFRELRHLRRTHADPPMVFLGSVREKGSLSQLQNTRPSTHVTPVPPSPSPRSSSTAVRPTNSGAASHSGSDVLHIAPPRPLPVPTTSRPTPLLPAVAQPQPQQPVLDVNSIIELIAQRIDRPHPASDRDSMPPSHPS
ncbi:hypothetical protein SCP_0103880 [Sparassis crispa]|uniref:Uncharacterized protein n=1 Tax=Sparassis crispa TaxID=139825 RepID=A0A401G5T1_9APHY|nr:hypothetical protein SCP_0103880 [Sparassis crispa]GBE77513.1 hypothetical protein SCP_0103880 [Sparassis crispa]